MRSDQKKYSTRTRPLSAILLLVLLQLTVAAQAKPFRLSDVSWLAGCWESRDDSKRLLLSEQWMKPAGGLMLGAGRTVENDKALEFEVMRIEQNGPDMIFIARPQRNAEETPFKAIKLGPTEVIFENMQHDFPQRVLYRRDGKKLSARIEGLRDGKLRGIDYPMTRTTCE